MNIENLGYMLEIYRCQSINKAAKNLFISQPSLSSMLKNLEAELGYKIFERTNTGIRPTEQGESFFRFADRVHSEYAKMKCVPQPSMEDNSLSVTAACSSFYAHAYFAFKRAHPAPPVTPDILREATIYESLQDIASNRTRLVVSYYSTKHAHKYEMYVKKAGLALHPMMAELPVKIVVGEDHPLASRASVDVAELAQYPFVTYYDIDYEDILGTVSVPEGADIQYVSSRASYYHAVREGGYISVSMDFAPGEAERMGCVCLPCDNYGDTNIAAYFTQAHYVLSEREEAFLAYVKRKLEKLYKRR